MKQAFIVIKGLTASMFITILAVFAISAALPATTGAQAENEPYVLPEYENTDTTAQEDPNTNPIENQTTPDIQNNLCAGANLEVGTNCETPLNGNTEDPNDMLNDLIADVINMFSLVVGVVAVIMIIVGGFKYITSGGDSTKVGSAKNTILYALIGLVIVALSQTIVRFILSRVIIQS